MKLPFQRGKHEKPRTTLIVITACLVPIVALAVVVRIWPTLTTLTIVTLTAGLAELAGLQLWFARKSDRAD